MKRTMKLTVASAVIAGHIGVLAACVQTRMAGPPAEQAEQLASIDLSEPVLASAPPAMPALRAPPPAGIMPEFAYAPAPSAEPYRERYDGEEVSAIRLAANEPVSTFSVDVDTGAYANVRRFLSQGSLPPEAAVRTE